MDCVYDVVKNRLDRSKDWSKSSKEELVAALRGAYAPGSSFAWMDLLSKVQFRHQGSSNALNVNALLYSRLFLKFYQRNQLLRFPSSGL